MPLNTLTDGHQCRRSGLVNVARRTGSDSALTRYQVQLAPWLWVLTQSFRSRVFQDKTVREIIDQIFTGYADYASWRFTSDAVQLLSAVRPRSYCVQYRESDFDFVLRLLAEEGLGYCFVEDELSPSGHRLVIFGDSPMPPEDPTSTGATGLRFHSADTTEEQDTIQFMGRAHQLGSHRVTPLSSDYKRRQAISASRPIGPEREGLESYDPVGDYAFATLNEAEHYTHTEQASWQGCGTMRSARAGTRLHLGETPWAATEHMRDMQDFLFTEVRSYGVNNLEFGVPELDADTAALLRLETLDAEALKCNERPPEAVTARDRPSISPRV